MLVALVFSLFLMAGLASIFKASIGSFATASETISSGRRNRMAMDLLSDDLNMAGMVPSDLFGYPRNISTTNPAFRITPNVAYTGTDADAKADMLDFYYDNVLPFDGSLDVTLTPTSVQVANGGETTDNKEFTITFRDADQAAQVESAFTAHPISIFFKSAGWGRMLTSATASGKVVTAKLATASDFRGSGTAEGATFTNAAVKDTDVTLIQPGRYVRYSIKPQSLDPDPANSTIKTPCLVREEVTYSSTSTTPFATPDSTITVAENVTGFKVYLSGDGGKTWAGMDNSTGKPDMSLTDWSEITGPGAGAATPTLNWQFASGTVKARTGMNSTDMNTFWFREIPTLVRVDITTRTVNKRTEYTSTLNTSDYKTQTQSLIMTPRHFGLAYQPVF